MSSAMSKPSLDADTILKRAAPVTGQHAHEIQPFGHLVRMPIALSEHACKESVDNLNQLLADTMTLRDLYKRRRLFLGCRRGGRKCQSKSRACCTRTRSC